MGREGPGRTGGVAPSPSPLGGPRDREGPAPARSGGGMPIGGGGLIGRAPRSRETPNPPWGQDSEDVSFDYGRPTDEAPSPPWGQDDATTSFPGTAWGGEDGGSPTRAGVRSAAVDGLSDNGWGRESFHDGLDAARGIEAARAAASMQDSAFGRHALDANDRTKGRISAALAARSPIGQAMGYADTVARGQLNGTNPSLGSFGVGRAMRDRAHYGAAARSSNERAGLGMSVASMGRRDGPVSPGGSAGEGGQFSGRSGFGGPVGPDGRGGPADGRAGMAGGTGGSSGSSSGRSGSSSGRSSAGSTSGRGPSGNPGSGGGLSGGGNAGRSGWGGPGAGSGRPGSERF